MPYAIATKSATFPSIRWRLTRKPREAYSRGSHRSERTSASRSSVNWAIAPLRSWGRCAAPNGIRRPSFFILSEVASRTPAGRLHGMHLKPWFTRAVLWSGRRSL